MKRLFLLCGICIVSQVAVAQCKLTVSVSFSGNCAGSLDGRLQKAVAEQMAQHWNGMTFNNSIDCERAGLAARNDISGSYGGCTAHVTILCGGCSGASKAGSIDVIGVSKGTSFYSTNGANEIRDWSNDDMERMLALNPDYPYFDPVNVPTGDPEFDSAIQEININMPGDFDLIEKPNDNNNQDLEDYMIVGGARIPVSVLNKPFNSLGEAHSDDLKFVNIELKPVESLGTEHYDNEEGFFHKAFRTIDEKMDWYESENPNVFQYMYTKWGKDNVIAGVDWWERNDVGSRLGNAFGHPIDTYNNVREGAIDKLKEGVTPTIQFFIPPQYEKPVNNAIEIVNTEKGIIERTLSFVKNAPDMIDRGDISEITYQSNKINKENKDDIHNLGISVVNPGMSKSVRRLQAVEDIYSLPKDKQKKGLTDLLKREGKGMVKSEIKKSEKYKKMKKKGKAIVDPYNFIFD